MPKIGFKTPDGSVVEFGISFTEIAEAIRMLGRKKDKYLNYSVASLKTVYSDPALLWLTSRDQEKEVIAPYTVEFDYRRANNDHKWGAVRVTEPFCFPGELALHKDRMVKQFSEAGKLFKGDRACPRVASFEVTQDNDAVFTVQEARYYDQVGSNLTLDIPLETSLQTHGCESKTPRQWDMHQAGLKASPASFNKSRLANTIGVAVGISARDKNGEIHPFKRMRAKSVAVYEGQWHLPFSFALAWKPGLTPGTALSLSDLISQDWAHEFAEELKLELSDFDLPRPLAFCRDLVRGGKPQFFFDIQSRLTPEELHNRVGIDPTEYVGDLQGSMGEKNRFSPELLAYSMLVQGSV